MEINSEGKQPRKQAGIWDKAKKTLRVLSLVSCVLWFLRASAGLLAPDRRVHSLWDAALPLILVIVLALSLFDNGLDRIMRSTFGVTKCIRLCSPKIEELIRTRYQSEIEHLRAIGFNPLFSLGESFSLFRAFLVFPALVFALMWIKREVLTIQGGTELILAYPVFGDKDKTAFAFPFGLGVKFYTAFQDGTLLVSKSFKDRTPESPALVKQGREGSICDTWTEHQNRIRELEAEGKRVDRQTSFDFFSDIVRRG